MSLKYDIFLACAEKDYMVMPFLLTSIAENLAGWESIHVCTPNPAAFRNACGLAWPKLVLWSDEQLMPWCEYVLKRIPYRPNWVLQQLLKLTQSATTCDYYLTIDCDTVLLRPLPMFVAGQPVWRIGPPQRHEQYYRFNNALFGDEPEFPGTFLADMNFFYRPFLCELRDSVGCANSLDFVAQCLKHITKTCYPSEADLYMQWVMRKYPTHYYRTRVQTAWQGREAMGSGWQWIPEEIGAWLRAKRADGFETAALHSYTS